MEKFHRYLPYQVAYNVIVRNRILLFIFVCSITFRKYKIDDNEEKKLSFKMNPQNHHPETTDTHACRIGRVVLVKLYIMSARRRDQIKNSYRVITGR